MNCRSRSSKAEIAFEQELGTMELCRPLQKSTETLHMLQQVYGEREMCPEKAVSKDEN